MIQLSFVVLIITQERFLKHLLMIEKRLGVFVHDEHMPTLLSFSIQNNHFLVLDEVLD